MAAPLRLFQERYVDPRFERAGLFHALQEAFNIREVLYPGCSVHLTPAFHFPHVVFVDQDPQASAFFDNRTAILALVRQNKTYRRSPHVEFLHADFTEALPFRRQRFDLVLALFTGGVARTCCSYLKAGGLLVTNNHQDDALDATQDPALALIALASMHKGRYRVSSVEESTLLPTGARLSAPRYLRDTGHGVEYIETERYYIFKHTERQNRETQRP